MRFVKEVLKPAEYLATNLDGTRGKKTITADDLRSIADTGQKMLAAGLKIPAPWKHNLAAPLGPVFDGKSPETPSSENAGWWERFYFDEGTQTLLAELDVPLEEDAKRVGTTVREVSPIIKSFPDGSGHKWENAPFHIALVTHPIMGGQANFQQIPIETPVEMAAGFALALSDVVAFSSEQILQRTNESGKLGSDTEGIAMAQAEKKEAPKKEKAEKKPDSELDGTKGGGGNKSVGDGEATPAASTVTMKDLLGMLSKIGLALPEDTTVDNLAERMFVAGNAIIKAHENQNQDPENQPITEPVPVAMSLLGESNMAETPNPFKEIAVKQARDAYVARVEKLVETGRLPPAAASTIFKPALEGFAMSIGEDNAPVEPKMFSVGEVLKIFEMFPANTILNVAGGSKTDKGKNGVAFSFEQDPTDEMNGAGPWDGSEQSFMREMPEDKRAAMVAAQLKRING